MTNYQKPKYQLLIDEIDTLLEYPFWYWCFDNKQPKPTLWPIEKLEEFRNKVKKKKESYEKTNDTTN